MKAHKEMFANVFLFYYKHVTKPFYLKNHTNKKLLVQYEVEEYVLHLLENEMIRIGIVMGDLQKEL